MTAARIISPGKALPSGLSAAVVTVGVFDGFHAGHQRVIAAAVAEAARGGGPAVLVTFDRHPLRVTDPARAPALLTTLDEKISLLRDSGPDLILIERFDAQTAALGYRQYLSARLCGAIGMRHLVIGYDFHLGRGREGARAQLAAAGRKGGFGVTIVPAVVIGGSTVSSTRIRKDIVERHLRRAARFLTREYFFDARVTRGRGMGRRLGFPTANVSVASGEKLIPPAGVYAVRVESRSRLHAGMMNIGTAPTVRHDGHTTIEVHLFDFDGELRGDRLRIHCVEHIREERDFGALGRLRAQLLLDRKTAEAILKKND